MSTNLPIIWTDEIVMKIGESSSNNEEFANLRRVLVQWVDGAGNTDTRPKPVTTLNSTNPKYHYRPHKSVVGEIHVAGRNYKTVKSNGSLNKKYIIPNGKNPVVPWTYLTYKSYDGNTYLVSFNNFVFADDGIDITTDNEVVTVYPFVACYYDEAPM